MDEKTETKGVHEIFPIDTQREQGISSLFFFFSAENNLVTIFPTHFANEETEICHLLANKILQILADPETEYIAPIARIQ